MKKFIIGIIMGAFLATAGSVYAADIKTLVGKAIEGEIPVKVNGKALDKKAIIIDGTSYLPVRAIGDALNVNIMYNADLGVELTPKEAPSTMTVPVTMTADDAEALKSSEEQIVIAEQRIVDLKIKVSKVDEDIALEQGKLDSATEESVKRYHSENIKVLTNNRNSLNDSIKMAQDSITSQQAYIAKIKAKY